MVKRDHGGNLDAAQAAFGGADWIDLSTGINRRPYPLPALPPEAWSALPTAPALARLTEAAAAAYATTPGRVLPLAGAQAAIQLYPRLARPGRARLLAPTYNEHAAALRAEGWPVTEVATLEALAGADIAVVVNPNNPTGAAHAPDRLRALAAQVGLLVVDESFADPQPGLSLAAHAPDNAVILRSFGKFYGLAGLRLGFALAAPGRLARLAALAGPWSVSGPALEIGAAALADRGWQAATRARLAQDAARLDALAARAGWALLGGTPLFRTYATESAEAAQTRLARAAIWTRRFPYSDTWLRLGLPDGADWARVETALAQEDTP